MSRCRACQARHGPFAAFCPGCGVPLHGEAEPTRATGGQLALALASYFALLVVSLAFVIVGGIELRVLRYVHGGLLAAALATLGLASARMGFPGLGAFVALPRVDLRLAARVVGGLAAALGAAFLLDWAWSLDDGLYLQLYRDQGEGFGGALIDTVLLAPLLEETVFRGIILMALAGAVGRRGALWASALMFATLHLTPLTVVHHTLLGAVCGHARLETKSLLVPVLLHAAYNALVLLFTW